MYAEGNTTELLQEQTEIAGTELTEVGTEPDGNRGIALLLLFFVFIMIAINGICLAAFAVEKRLRGYNNYFIINLTISDFIFGIFLVITCLHMYLGRLPFPFPVRCKVFYGVSNSIQFVSNLIIVTICVDRHRATYDPIGHFTRRRKRTALYTNICVWLVSFVFWFSYSTVPDYILQFRLGSECFHWYSVFPIAQLSTVLIRFIIPFTIMLILYIRIFIKIRGIAGGRHIDKEFTEDTTVSDHSLPEGDVMENKQRPQVKTISGVQKAANREPASEVRSATKTLLFIVMAFFITWFPTSLLAIVITIDRTLGYPRLPYWDFWITIWLVYVNGLLNPICYVISQPLFRKTVFGLLCRPIRYCRC
ncbi:muscarinic acetylcholine receptor M5-like [Lytechinus pictus]|uniref:muscarinic acetylcholine receptor M5-like n=1 Tax=Lytechinus pictus TaxID=7653 RepID=UPI0030B9EF02